jgi:hypothetical protein
MVEGAESNAKDRAALEQSRRDRDAANRLNGVLKQRVDELESELGIRQSIQGIVLRPPKWQTKDNHRNADHHSVAWMHFSDWHFDEVVEAPLMNGLNAYNRRIAEIRLQRWAQNVNKVLAIQSASYDWDGGVLSVNGDVFSGWIHGLKETNDGHGLFKDVRHWAERIVAAVELVLEVLPKLSIYVTVGNHGRLSQKWDSKRAVSENIEYLLGLTLADWYAGDDRVEVTVAESVDLLFPVYDLKILQTHGNTGAGKGGNGIAGFWPRLNRMRLTKQTLYRHQGGFDVMGVGHFHQYKPSAVGYSGFIVNGSGKGFDDYARDEGFEAEEAIQALVQIAPKRGVIAHYPIFVTDRKAEGW